MSAVGITENVKGDVKKFEIWYSSREVVYIVQVCDALFSILSVTEKTFQCLSSVLFSLCVSIRLPRWRSKLPGWWRFEKFSTTSKNYKVSINVDVALWPFLFPFLKAWFHLYDSCSVMVCFFLVLCGFCWNLRLLPSSVISFNLLFMDFYSFYI